MKTGLGFTAGSWVLACGIPAWLYGCGWRVLGAQGQVRESGSSVEGFRFRGSRAQDSEVPTGPFKREGLSRV